MRKLRLMLGAAAMAMACAAAPAHAGTPELLKKLLDKGILSQEEYDELMAEDARSASTAQAAQPMDAAASSLDDKRVVRMTESGIGFEVGPATIKFSGSVNAFYVHDNGDDDFAPVVGGVATSGENTSAIRNGLLPGFFKVDVTTQQEGFDIGAHFGMYPGINSVSYANGANSAGSPQALSTNGIDFRQVYLTIGKAGFGELKMGRDIGLFASEGILNDITLLASGTPAGNVAPSNTTLGRIGVGYIYTDFQPQITYSSPNLGGFQASVGVFEPLRSLTPRFDGEENSQPQFQAKLTYDAKFGDAGSARVWLSGITQKHDVIDGPDYTGQGFDTGAKVTFGPVTLTGYYYRASGLGTTALNLFDTGPDGETRDSDGFYLQGLATFGKFSVGGSYGVSNLDHANDLDELLNPDLVEKNSSWIGQVRYGLTSWVTLLGEYVSTRSEAHSGAQNDSQALAAGAILFF